MSVELRSGKYAFRKTRVGSRIVSEYLGRGALAVQIAEEDRAERERRLRERWAWAARRKSLEAEERRVVAWFKGIETLAEAILVECGFHKHRSEWRRRMGEITIMTKGGPMAQTRRGADISREEEIHLMEQVRDGISTALPKLREAFEATARGERTSPIFERAGNPVEWLKSSMFGDVNDDCAIAATAARVKLEQVQRELEGENPTKIESMLAERAAICWSLTFQYETRYAQAKSGTTRELEYLQRRIDRAHRRFMSALRTLAQVRRLAVPQVVVAMAENQQVNVNG